MMKALVCKNFGPLEDLQIMETDTPRAGAGEVVINIHATGVNFPDGLLVQGLYQLKPECPFTPGAEIAGSVAEVGEAVTTMKQGQRVVAFCMLGGFAEKIRIDARAVLPLPEAIPYDEAAGLLTAHATAHHALRQRGNLQADEVLLVTGAAGGTGLAAVQIGKAIGAKVIAVCSSEEKLAVAKANGADVLINYTEQDLKTAIKEATEGRGVDVVYECVGGDTFKACLSGMSWGGRLLVIGFAGGEIPSIPANLTLVKGCSVVGVFWGTFTAKQPKVFAANMEELMRWYLQGKVKVVIDETFPLSDATGAISKVMSRQAKGKVIVVPEQES